MPDRQFSVPGTGAAPFAWLLSPDLQIEPKIAYASFNGAAAAGSFLPCLRLISDSGHVAAEAVSSTTVAAGGSADVSWFRGLRNPCGPNGWPNNGHTDAVLALGPWAYWELNEADGVSPVADASGHGRSMAVDDAGVIGGRSSIIPTSGDSSMYVLSPGAGNAAPFVSATNQTWTPAVGSWAHWVNMPSTLPHEIAFGILGTINSATSFSFRFGTTAAGQAEFIFQDSGGTDHTITSAIGLADNSTHHVVWVLDGTNLTLYKDGALADQQAQPAAMISPFTAKQSVGQWLGGAGNRFYTGYIQHVAWYDKALTAADVTTLYDAGTVI